MRVLKGFGGGRPGGIGGGGGGCWYQSIGEGWKQHHRSLPVRRVVGEIHINQRTNQNIAPINEAWNPGHTDIVKLLLAQVYIWYI